MDMRARLRKAAGLFVTLPPEESTDEVTPTSPPRTVEQLVRESEGPNLDEIRYEPPVAQPAPTLGSTIDFNRIYEQAGLPVAPFTAEQMVEMIRSLPSELPLAMQRQTVNVTLNAMGKSIGATPDSVVSDASRKLAALTAYTDDIAHQTAQYVESAEREIAALQAQIEEKRQSMVQYQEQLQKAVQVCHAESDRLDDVLEFFSLDIPPSRLSPSTIQTK